MRVLTILLSSLTILAGGVLGQCTDSASDVDAGWSAACEQIDELAGEPGDEPAAAQIQEMALPAATTLLGHSDDDIVAAARDLVDGASAGNTSKVGHAIDALHNHCQLREMN